MPVTIEARDVQLLRQNRWEEALDHFLDFHRAFPGHVEMILEIAKIHFKKREYAKAKEWLLKAAALPLSESHVRTALELTNYQKIASDRHFNSHPKFSQDGEWLTFVSARQDTNGDGKIDATDNAALYAIHLQSQTEVEIVSNDFFNSHPSLSTALDQVLFLSARRDRDRDGRVDHNDVPGLYIKNISTGREECLVESKHRPKFPSFSPDHQSVLFCAWHSGAKRCGIYQMNLKDRVVRILHDAFESTYPSYSPDGKKVIFSGWQSDTNGDGVIDIQDNSGIFELEIATGKVTRIVNDSYSNFYPSYSPDGLSRVFLSRRRDTNRDGVINSLDDSGVHVIDRYGFERRIVADDRHNKFPVFSSDAQRVVFVSTWPDPERVGAPQAHYFENKGIYSVGTDGMSLTEIVSNKHFGCRFLCASPRRNQIAYAAWRSDTHRGLYLADLDHLPSQKDLIRLIETNI